MDSKLKRAVIAISIFCIIIVLTIVIMSNLTTIQKKLNKKETVTATSTEEVTTTSVKDSLQLGNDLNAWKSDEDFFDSEEDTLAARLMEEMITLDFKALSVERDMRVRILDFQGNLKTGEEFAVTLQKGSEEPITITDSDEDGVLYTNMLAPGDYTVSLDAIDGYIVPEDKLTVNVPDTVEYKKIEDISLLITDKTDSEKAIDDLMTVSAEGDADKKQQKGFGSDSEVIYGIDASEKNGEVDWNKVYASGIRFVMLRAGYRGAVSGDLYVDDSFYENARGAIRAGLDVGVYFFSQATTEVEAVEEASLVLEQCKDLQITYPIAFRADQAGGLGRADEIPSETRTELAKAFCETIKSAGYDPCVYASANWLTTNLDAKALESYHLWVSELKRDQSTKKYYYDMWQYSTAGSVDGVEGNVSLNISYIN